MMPTLVVGVNLLWCLPGEVGGSEEYLARQLAGLHDADARDHHPAVRAARVRRGPS